MQLHQINLSSIRKNKHCYGAFTLEQNKSNASNTLCKNENEDFSHGIFGAHFVRFVQVQMRIEQTECTKYST